jgi:hypothetical protein
VIYSVFLNGATEYTAVARPGGSPTLCPPDGWCNENIHNAVPNGVSIAVAADGTEHTAFTVQNTCFYEKRSGGVWQSEVTVATGIQGPWPVDLAIDAGGTPAIAFSRASDVALAVTDGTQWAIRSVASAPSPRYASIGLNNGYLARIVYDRSTSGATYAEQVLPVGVADGQSWAKGAALFNLGANPAHQGARFGVRLDVPQELRLSIYDASGRTVRVLADGSFPTGTHEFDWDLRETGGTRVGSGLYFVRLTAASGERRGRMVVVQ